MAAGSKASGGARRGCRAQKSSTFSHAPAKSSHFSTHTHLSSNHLHLSHTVRWPSAPAPMVSPASVTSRERFSHGSAPAFLLFLLFPCFVLPDSEPPCECAIALQETPAPAPAPLTAPVPAPPRSARATEVRACANPLYLPALAMVFGRFPPAPSAHPPPSKERHIP